MLIRYSTVGTDGITREERNERFDQPNPEWDIPEEGLYLWDWYFEAAKGTNRILDGVAQPVEWEEFRAYVETNDILIYPFEYAILRDMDTAYVSATNEELNLTADELRAKAEAEAKKMRRK